MLDKCPATAVLVAKDLDRAKKFYQEKLGLKLRQGPEGVIIFEAGNGTTVALYQKEGGSKAIHTVLAFEVNHLEEVLQTLKSQGVEQDMDGLPEGANEQGIVSYGPVKSAWIKDSEGNIIALNQMG
jgi:predicted enzyme related to lactoylglutathione lyase